MLDTSSDGDTGTSRQLTDAAVNVAHVAAELLEYVRREPGGQGYVVSRDDIEALRAAVHDWRAAGQAFLESLSTEAA